MATFVQSIEDGSDGFNAVAGEDISAGELVTVDLDTDEAFLACSADGEENLPAMGMATYDVAEGEMGFFRSSGIVRELPTNADGFMYCSETAGEFSATAGNTSQVVAKVTNAAEGIGELAFAIVAHNHPAAS